jgi:hypothetical protein
MAVGVKLPKAPVDARDHRIDAPVYESCGFTEAEVEVDEGAAGNSCQTAGQKEK